MEEEIKNWIGLNHFPQVSAYQEVIWFRSEFLQSQKFLLLLASGLLQFEVTGGYLKGVP